MTNTNTPQIDELREGLELILRNYDGSPAIKLYLVMEQVTKYLSLKDAEHAIELELARIEQDKYSRADEFLWVTRKLREYMGSTTSPYYKTFESNFVKQYEPKYKEYFKQKELLNEK